MADLRAACVDAGLGNLETYIQTGNLVLEHDDPHVAEIALETLIARQFGLDVPVVARTAAAWDALVSTCPFPNEAEADPGKLHLLACKQKPVEDAVRLLQSRAKDAEKITFWRNEIAIYFGNGVGSSRLLPVVIDRLIGTSATARNWNTVLKLQEMAAR